MSNSSEQLAFACDIGSTTMAGSVVTVAGGRRVGFASAPNPQREFGADVTARLGAACRAPERHRELVDLLRVGVRRLAEEACRQAGVPLASLRRAALAGNPAMEHFLLGLPVASLAFPPFRPLFTTGRSVSTAEIGWEIAREAYLFPLPGGYVGGDLVAFLYGADAASSGSRVPSSTLYLDIGTNTEMALVTPAGSFATSAASGPAFEGGNIGCGMPAGPGAITALAIEGDRVILETIPGAPVSGLCGTAVIEAAAAMLLAGVVDRTGRLLAPEEVSSNLALRIRGDGGGRAFILHRDSRREVSLSQEDIRQLQLAKGAVRAGMEVLFRRAGVTSAELRGVVLTGAFGAQVSPEALKTIGIFTPEMVEICGFVREGALKGVELLLGAPGGSGAVEALAASLKVVPLSGTPVFEKFFLEQMDFPDNKPDER